MGVIDENCIEGVDSVINLAGSPIAQLWTKKTKKSILDSRVKSVNLLKKIILNDNKKNIKQFACASAQWYHALDDTPHGLLPSHR